MARARLITSGGAQWLIVGFSFLARAVTRGHRASVLTHPLASQPYTSVPHTDQNTQLHSHPNTPCLPFNPSGALHDLLSFTHLAHVSLQTCTVPFHPILLPSGILDISPTPQPFLTVPTTHRLISTKPLCSALITFSFALLVSPFLTSYNPSICSYR